MNNINFEQTGGFPIETDTFSFLQNAYKSLAALTGLGGQNYILSGCEITGGNVATGVVVINGEILPFLAGPKLAQLVIEETVIDKTFEDGLSKPTYYNRVAKLSATGGIIDFDALKRVSNLTDISERIKDQAVTSWIPNVSSDGRWLINNHQCYMYRQGRSIRLFGSITMTYTGTTSTNDLVGVNGVPVLGEVLHGASGVSYIRNATLSGPITLSYLTKTPFGDSLAFRIDTPGTTEWVINFQIDFLLV